MAETFALFADATSSPIVLGFLEPEDTPLKPIPINVEDKQVLSSASNGFYAAYQVLTRLEVIRGDKYCFSYQFKANDLTFYALGESAGLAFCLKLAQEVSHRKTGERLPYSIAATGMISDGTEKAEVRGVSGINAKLEAALTCLQKGDKLFYPSQNEEDIGPELMAEAADKGIELIPVATVAQALQRLVEKFPAQEPHVEPYQNQSGETIRVHAKWRVLNLWSVAILMLACLGLLMYWYQPAPEVAGIASEEITGESTPPIMPTPPQAKRMESTDPFQRVGALMREFFPNGGDFQVQLWPDKGVDAVYVEGEKIVVHVLAETRAYVQVDFYQSDGKVTHLLPNLLNDNHLVEAGRPLIIGKPGSLYQFPVTAPFGEDLLTVIASGTPLEEKPKVQTVEPAAAYLDRLTMTLSEHRTKGKLAGAQVLIRTQKKQSPTQAEPQEERKKETGG